MASNSGSSVTCLMISGGEIIKTVALQNPPPPHFYLPVIPSFEVDPSEPDIWTLLTRRIFERGFQSYFTGHYYYFEK